MTFIASLPMYDWPEVRSCVDAQWAALRLRLLEEGIEAAAPLVRSNVGMPAVAGGIRDRAGKPIAPDPATLPSAGFDIHTLWRHPDLLLAQTCWGPMERGLASQVVVLGQPAYDGIEGGKGELYSSAILMRSRERRTKAPEDGRAVLPLELMRGARLAYNEPHSMSGMMALTRDLEAAGESLSLFSGLIVTGSHRGSIVAVAEELADICAIDCRSWEMARLHEPKAADLEPVGWTSRRMGLPFITSWRTPGSVVETLKSLLSGADHVHATGETLTQPMRLDR